MTNREIVTTSSIGTIPTTLSTGMINPMTEVGPTYNNGSLYPKPKECIPVGTDLTVMEHRAVSPSSGHIIREGAAIFTDMTETMLDTLDQQMVLSTEAQKPESSLTDNIVTTGQLAGNHQVGETSTRSQMTCDPKDIYPDLYLPVVENHRLSENSMGTQTVCLQISTKWYWQN